MSDVADDIEKGRVPLGTVFKWIGSIVGVLVLVLTSYFRLESRADQMEYRINNLESHVVWRQQ